MTRLSPPGQWLGEEHSPSSWRPWVGTQLAWPARLELRERIGVGLVGGVGRERSHGLWSGLAFILRASGSLCGEQVRRGLK